MPFVEAQAARTDQLNNGVGWVNAVILPWGGHGVSWMDGGCPWLRLLKPISLFSARPCPSPLCIQQRSSMWRPASWRKMRGWR